MTRSPTRSTRPIGPPSIGTEPTPKPRWRRPVRGRRCPRRRRRRPDRPARNRALPARPGPPRRPRRGPPRGGPPVARRPAVRGELRPDPNGPGAVPGRDRRGDHTRHRRRGGTGRLAAADDLATTVARRPLTAAREAHERAGGIEEPGERASALEDALDSYRVVAGLVGGEGTPFAGGEETARTEIETVLGELIEARLASARERRTAGDWEWDAGNEEVAYDLLSSARDDLDRAIELAEEFPPGDPEEIRATRDDLADHFDVLAIRYELSQTGDELQH
ncbi:hypothetical protein ACFQL1_04925 [Halomicroarcula sp. GCM10025709]|uniref:hypothetical protein n=1 Tax=Halomicroarcula sp. GCM10025709 TaxID=3252669 RepID=UPI003608536E